MFAVAARYAASFRALDCQGAWQEYVSELTKPKWQDTFGVRQEHWGEKPRPFLVGVERE